MLKKITKNQQGVTLIELLIVTLILAFIALAVSAFSNTAFRSQQATTASLNNIQNLRSSLEKSFREIRFAQNVFILDDGKQLRCVYPNGSIRIFSLNLSNNYLWDGTTILSKAPLNNLTFTPITTLLRANGTTYIKTVQIRITLPDTNSYNTSISILNAN